MALAAVAAAGLVSAEFSNVVAHLPAAVASDGGPFIGAGRAEGVAHYRPTLLQDCRTQFSTGKHTHCCRGEPLYPGLAVLAIPSWSWCWNPAVQSLHPYVIQRGPGKGLPPVPISLQQVPGHLVRGQGFGNTLQYN